ncbi:glycosyltransferase family 4 protein [Gemmata sp. JC717]|uniref:glycosyltransferase family 4 protein n=1 Tax=Gemmata algarum TaxID=2975278 RepID=UPI0021BB9E5B|nr:glycosyltransferase family 4 protein [Gemmata algarum]MDY3552672.1 glycosyltransferase family 4 protein [Gemmata algarum]
MSIVPDSPFTGIPNRPAEQRLHLAQFVQRFPPALGGSETYTARLCAYLAAQGDRVDVWTSTAIELSEMWGRPTLPSLKRGGETPPFTLSVLNVPSGSEASFSPLPFREREPGERGLRRYPPLHFPGRRYLLKGLSLVPHRRWQCLTAPCNPVCPQMWRDTGAYNGPLDAVHATAFPYAFPIACGLRLARRRGVPFLLTPFLHLGDPHDPHDRTRRQYTKPHLRWLLKQADRVFLQTAAERDAAVALGVPEGRVILQGLGVDPVECTGGDRTTARAGWGVETTEVVVGHLANNSTEKGTVDLLRAAARLWARGSRFRVVLAGPEMPNFRAFWDTFEPKAHVTRLGRLSETQKLDFFAGIDCFALPSRSDSFGLVLLEAWANAKPNLVYRAGGPAELVRDGTDGLQAGCGDINELAAQLGRLVADVELRRRLGDRGRSRVSREFRWEDKLELVRNTIRSAIAERTGTE